MIEINPIITLPTDDVDKVREMIKFCRARLSEELKITNEVVAPWEAMKPRNSPPYNCRITDRLGGTPMISNAVETTEFVTRFSPTRMNSETMIKLIMLSQAEAWLEDMTGPGPALRWSVGLMVSIWSDHPDCPEEWKP